MNTREKGCCDRCDRIGIQVNGDRVTFCADKNCPCHSPASLVWEEEFFALKTLEKMEDENIDGLEIRDFIRTKLAEQKAAIVKALPGEKERGRFDDEIDNEVRESWNAYRQAALKVIEETP